MHSLYSAYLSFLTEKKPQDIESTLQPRVCQQLLFSPLESFLIEDNEQILQRKTPFELSDEVPVSIDEEKKAAGGYMEIERTKATEFEGIIKCFYGTKAKPVGAAAREPGEIMSHNKASEPDAMEKQKDSNSNKTLQGIIKKIKKESSKPKKQKRSRFSKVEVAETDVKGVYKFNDKFRAFLEISPGDQRDHVGDYNTIEEAAAAIKKLGKNTCVTERKESADLHTKIPFQMSGSLATTPSGSLVAARPGSSAIIEASQNSSSSKKEEELKKASQAEKSKAKDDHPDIMEISKSQASTLCNFHVSIEPPLLDPSNLKGTSNQGKLIPLVNMSQGPDKPAITTGKSAPPSNSMNYNLTSRPTQENGSVYAQSNNIFSNPQHKFSPQKNMNQMSSNIGNTIPNINLLSSSHSQGLAASGPANNIKNMQNIMPTPKLPGYSGLIPDERRAAEHNELKAEHSYDQNPAYAAPKTMNYYQKTTQIIDPSGQQSQQEAEVLIISPNNQNTNRGKNQPPNFIWGQAYPKGQTGYPPTPTYESNPTKNHMTIGPLSDASRQTPQGFGSGSAPNYQVDISNYNSYSNPYFSEGNPIYSSGWDKNKPTNFGAGYSNYNYNQTPSNIRSSNDIKKSSNFSQSQSQSHSQNQSQSHNQIQRFFPSESNSSKGFNPSSSKSSNNRKYQKD